MTLMEYSQKDQPDVVIRVRMPRGKEVIGTITEIFGGSRLHVSCRDGKTRMCRIPGKFRKRITIHPGDAVLVIPWDVEPDTKGDVEWIYTRTQAGWLKRKGLI